MLHTLRATVLFLLFTTFAFQAFAEEIRYQKTSDAGVTYELIIEAETPEVMKALPVRLNLFDEEGTQITGAQIGCSLTMPAMAMPNNKPPIKESDQPGQYEGIFLLTMGVLWHVELTMSCCNGKNDAIVIPVPGVMSDSKENDIDDKLESLFHEKKN